MSESKLSRLYLTELSLKNYRTYKGDDNKIEFINSIPQCDIDDNYEKPLFQKSSKGTFLSRFFSQITMLFNELGSDGGVFVVIGKKINKWI